MVIAFVWHEGANPRLSRAVNMYQSPWWREEKNQAFGVRMSNLCRRGLVPTLLPFSFTSGLPLLLQYPVLHISAL